MAGVTSAGVFLQVENRRVVFLSGGTGRGPLSIYLHGSCPEFKQRIQVGMTARCGEGRLSFPPIRWAVSCQSLPGWSAPVPARLPAPIAEQRQRLASLVLKAIEGRELRGMSGMLPNLLGMPLTTGAPAMGVCLFESARHAQAVLQTRNAESVLESLVPFYGLGPGLTPSGDDLIIGILLMQARWQSSLWEAQSLEQLKQGVIERAFQSTTALSASLIECSAGGQADERLIHAVDYLAQGQPGEDESLAGLLSWGSSSGLDTLAGMAVAVLGQ